MLSVCNFWSNFYRSCQIERNITESSSYRQQIHLTIKKKQLTIGQSSSDLDPVECSLFGNYFYGTVPTLNSSSHSGHLWHMYSPHNFIQSSRAFLDYLLWDFILVLTCFDLPSWLCTIGYMASQLSLGVRFFPTTYSF